MTWPKFTEYWNSDAEEHQEVNARAPAVLRGSRKDRDGRRTWSTQISSAAAVRAGHHLGLEFLKESPEFQDRYLETVTYRIFYSVNAAWNGKMTLRELRRSDLLEAMTHVDDEEDINKVLRFFSSSTFTHVPQVLGAGQRPRLPHRQGGSAAVREPRADVPRGGQGVRGGAARL